MKLAIDILVTYCIAYTISSVLLKLYKFLIKIYLRKTIDVGSDTYIKFKNQLESCIKSGEINSYFDGFQFVKVDRSSDSSDISELQFSTDKLTRSEKYKLQVFGKSLLENNL